MSTRTVNVMQNGYNFPLSRVLRDFTKRSEPPNKLLVYNTYVVHRECMKYLREISEHSKLLPENKLIKGNR